MVELKEQELLEAYQGSGWRRMPDQYRDQDGYWVGFAARLRVNIFNVRKVKPSDNTLEELLLHAPSRVVMAKPLFGTTLTQYTIMWHLWGPDTLKEWHHDLRSRGLREVNGNAAVKDVVATGACDAGLTDTDDFFVAVDDQQPVEMSAVRILRSGPVPQPLATGTRQESAGYTICVPNTVGIIKGTKRRNAAQRLVDFLASAETEMSLARAKSRQIPLGSVDEAQLPADVRQMKEWCRDGIELRSLLPARRDCLKWLQSEYLK